VNTWAFTIHEGQGRRTCDAIFFFSAASAFASAFASALAMSFSSFCCLSRLSVPSLLSRASMNVISTPNTPIGPSGRGARRHRRVTGDGCADYRSGRTCGTKSKIWDQECLEERWGYEGAEVKENHDSPSDQYFTNRSGCVLSSHSLQRVKCDPNSQYSGGYEQTIFSYS
jgi:hypothetical protein